MSNLIEFWFSNEKIWFNCSKEDDKIIYNKFYHLLNFEVDFGTYCCDRMLHYILLYDQCFRHFYRGFPKMPKYANEIALFFSRKLIRTGGIYNFGPEKRCFVLMPLRHTFDKDILEYVLHLIKKFMEEDPDNRYYRRFYYATVKSLSKIINKLSVEDEFKVNVNAPFPYDILDKDCNFIFQEIDESKMRKWKYLVKQFKSILKPDNKVTLSISGGVDSMVCSYILKYIGCDFKCFMINYGNRDSADLEVIMVGKWLEYLNVPFYVRKITEIKRSRDRDRDFYENVTRDIRFGMYKLLRRDVILGHNKDDTIENIFANLSKKQNYSNLFGMEKKSEIEGVTVLRPMLDITKKEIFEFAKDLGVPYLYDSTPKWSSRGKMRDELVPFLNGFDDNIIKGLCDLGDTMKGLYDTLEGLVLGKANISYDVDRKQLQIKRNGFENYVSSKIIFNELRKTFNIPRISQKSIKNFTNFCKYKSNKSKRNFVLSKNLNGFIINDNIILKLS